ncbi:MAG: hypothetical protein V2A34_08280 [Lentisphaerota bacterium]
MKDLSDKSARLFFWLLLLAGAAARIYGAWCSRIITDPDCGIVALMAKHMSEGREFPVFFYGQSYMGSLEPAVSALFCRLFGVSGFMVNLGPALVGFLLLPVLFFWGRKAGGHAAGLAAMLFCVIGPDQFYNFQFAARGGYPIALLLGTLVLMMSASLVHETRTREGKPRPLPFLLLGFLAGLGWWSNPIIMAALLTSGLMFLAGLRLSVLRWQIAPAALLGFMAGSLPFWMWNATHGWDSFAFLTAFQGTSLRAGARFLVERSVRLLGLEGMPFWMKGPLLLFYAGLPLALLAQTTRRLFRRDIREADLQVMAALIFLGLSSVLFMRSHFSHLNTVRYLLPFVPALALLIGKGTAEGDRLLPWRLAWIPLLIILLTQLPAVGRTREHALSNPENLRRQNEIRVFLAHNRIEAVYANYMFHSLNFLLGEEFCFSTIRNERYPLNAQRMDQADRIAVANNNGGIKEFMHYAGGGIQWQQAGDVYFVHGFSPPVFNLREIGSSQWTLRAHSLGQEKPAAITDDNLDTMMNASGNGTNSDWLVIQFRRPVPLKAIRWISHNDQYPAGWSAAVKTEGDAGWEPLIKPTPASLYFWSGERPFWGGEAYRLEARLTPQRPVQALRITLQSGGKNSDWNLADLQLFETAEPAASTTSIETVASTLTLRGIDRLYTDRWEANRISALSGGRIQTSQEPALWSAAALPSRMEFSLHTALLVRKENAAQVHRILAARNLALRETPMPPWVLFDFVPGLWNGRYTGNQGLVWKGFGCLLGDAKQYAANLVKKAEELHKTETSAEEAVALLEKAMQLYPHWTSPQALLNQWTGRKGGQESAASSERLVRFSNGVECMGVYPT